MNEKIHWLKLNTDTSEWSRLADKYLVREYVKEKGLGDILIPFEYEYALSNTYDAIPVRKDGKWGMVSPSNKTIVPTSFISILIPSERNTNDFWVMESAF